MLNPAWIAYNKAHNEGGEGFNPMPKFLTVAPTVRPEGAIASWRTPKEVFLACWTPENFTARKNLWNAARATVKNWSRDAEKAQAQNLGFGLSELTRAKDLGV